MVQRRGLLLQHVRRLAGQRAGHRLDRDRDYERLKDPAVDSTLAGAESTSDQTAALEPIAKYVAANLPIIPTTTSSQWFEYNSQNYSGWALKCVHQVARVHGAERFVMAGDASGEHVRLQVELGVGAPLLCPVPCPL